MPKVYIYVVDRDFGFAPNPFHGYMTLATCKPRIRSVASIGDWVIGLGGGRLKRQGRCIFGMQVSEAVSFQEYWDGGGFQEKKPIRNGSLVSLVGDNIYHKADGEWIQDDSHHSNPDGSPNLVNLRSDTSVNRVLVSHNFRYFGSSAPIVPGSILGDLGYTNRRNHRKFDVSRATPLLRWLDAFPSNRVLADPCDFAKASARYEGRSNRVVTE